MKANYGERHEGVLLAETVMTLPRGESIYGAVVSVEHWNALLKKAQAVLENTAGYKNAKVEKLFIKKAKAVKNRLGGKLPFFKKAT